MKWEDLEVEIWCGCVTGVDMLVGMAWITMSAVLGLALAELIIRFRRRKEERESSESAHAPLE